MQVEPQITFKNLETSPALEGLVRDRIDRLDHKHPRIISCRVVIEAPHRATESAKLALSVAVEIEVPGKSTIVAKDAQSRHDAKGDYTAALNNAFDAAERQLERAGDLRAGDLKTSEAAAQTAMVVRLFSEQGYGFLQLDNSPELYFTRNAVAADAFDELRLGMMVEVTPASEEGPMGPQASSVKLRDRARVPN